MSDLQKHERQNLSGQRAKIGGYQKAVRWARGSGLLKVDTFRKKPTLPPPPCHPPVQTPRAGGGRPLCPTSRVGSEDGINTSSTLLGKNCHTINWTWVGGHSAPRSQVLHRVGFPRRAFWSPERRLVACPRQQTWNWGHGSSQFILLCEGKPVFRFDRCKCRLKMLNIDLTGVHQTRAEPH